MNICLNMIVKNEVINMKDCLESFKPYINNWLIVDTGSSDGTQKLVNSIMKDVPGKLIERPWKDFGYNRSEAIDLAKQTYQSDYLITTDADFRLVSKCSLKKLLEDPVVGNKNYYKVKIKNDPTNGFYQTRILKTSLDWKYIGILHEYVACTNYNTIENGTIEEDCLYFKNENTGIRARTPDKFLLDALLLERCLEKNKNARDTFYLAQSYKDAGFFNKAIEKYKERVEMGEFVEEIWYSKYMIGVLSEQLKHEESIVINAYLDAYCYWPYRVEPLYQLAKLYRSKAKFHLGYLFAEKAIQIKYPKDLLFIDSSVYNWRCLFEYAVNGYCTCNFQKSLDACKQLLNKNMSESELNLIKKIMVECIKRIG